MATSLYQTYIQQRSAVGLPSPSALEPSVWPMVDHITPLQEPHFRPAVPGRQWAQGLHNNRSDAQFSSWTFKWESQPNAGAVQRAPPQAWSSSWVTHPELFTEQTFGTRCTKTWPRSRARHYINPDGTGFPRHLLLTRTHKHIGFLCGAINCTPFMHLFWLKSTQTALACTENDSKARVK